jgi:hypothetical protein
MRQITAKFNSKCAETGIVLKKGSVIYYDPHTKKAYHSTAKKVSESNEAEAIKSYIDAQESAYFDRYSSGYYNY